MARRGYTLAWHGHDGSYTEHGNPHLTRAIGFKEAGAFAASSPDIVVGGGVWGNDRDTSEKPTRPQSIFRRRRMILSHSFRLRVPSSAKTVYVSRRKTNAGGKN